MGKLTAKHVQHAKPGRHADGKGLYLLVKPTGAKSWVLRIVVNSRRRDFGLGPVDLVSLTEARDKATDGRKLVRAGLDPGLEWKKAAGGIPTFEQAARRFHAEVLPSWRNGKHGGQWLTTLEAHAFPRIGARRVDQIDAVDVQAVLLPIWLAIPETAKRVRQRVSVVLDYSHGQGWRATEAPRAAVNSLMKRIVQPDPGSFAAMAWADLPDFMARLRSMPASVGRLALEFLILTVARSGEVRFAPWGELKLDAGEWDIPGSRMKAGKRHIVPLVPRAVEILREVQGLMTGRAGEPVFPGHRGKPMSDATLAKAFKSAGGVGTVHGLRSSFRDWAADTGFADGWCESALAHGNPDATEAAYKRTTFFPHRQGILMPAWASFLGGQSNVVELVPEQERA